MFYKPEFYVFIIYMLHGDFCLLKYNIFENSFDKSRKRNGQTAILFKSFCHNLSHLEISYWLYLQALAVVLIMKVDG